MQNLRETAAWEDEEIVRLYGVDDRSQWLDFLDWESALLWKQSFEPARTRDGTEGQAH